MKVLIGTIALAIALGAAFYASTQESGAALSLYKTKCAVCHGTDGKGDTVTGKKLGVKDFRSPEVAKESDAELFEITKNGKGKMPSYDKKLTDDQIKDLMKYIRSLK